MAAIIETCKDVLRTSPIYESREEEFYLRQKRKSELLKNNSYYQNKAEKIAPKANNVFNAIQIIDNYSENYAEDMEKALGNALGIAGLALTVPLYGLEMWLLKNPKMHGTKSRFAALIPIIPMFALLFAASPWMAKKQIQASRTGRYQAIKNELNDVRNFVTYTPEQIEQAQSMKNDDKTKDKKSKSKNDFQNSVKILKEFKRDYAEYQKKRQTDNTLDLEFDEKLSQKYTEKQLEKAKEDRELIHNATKIINNKAEDYSENTENAYATLNALGALISLPIGYGIGAIVSKFVKKVSPAIVKSYGALGTMLFTMGVLMAGTQRQKLASRVGRYMAEKEMKNDLSSVMYFDENEINSINIENDYKKRGFFGKIFDNLTYLKRYNKDYKEYQEYKKTSEQANKKLLENLKKVDVTPQQLKEAEELQKKVLFVFDELDEMSQSYSENVEAATDMAAQAFSLLEQLILWGIVGTVMIKFDKRKFKISKILNKISNLIFDKNSTIRKSANEIYDVAKESKDTRKKVDNVLYDFMGGSKPNSKSSNFATQKRIAQPLMNLGIKIQEIKNNPATIKNEIKQNKIARYFYNLITDILKEKPRLARNKAKRLGKNYEPKPPKNNLEVLQNAFDDGKSEKMGKTLRNTLIIGGVPILSIIFLVPFAIQSWFTNMQKKAGKIGVMKALDNINNIEYYCDKI